MAMGRTIIVFLCGAVVGLGALGVPGFLSGEEDEHAKYGRDVPEMTPEAQAEMMKTWQAMATPGKYHERLGYFLGDWTTTTKMWMGPQAMESEGKATFRWLMKGRWMSQDYSGSVMGMPMRGFGISGYDNYRKAYVGCWMDSFSTVMATYEGGIDRSGKVIEQFGKMDEPTMGQIGKTAKYVTRIVDADTFVFELHDLDIIGGQTKVVEITYTRATK
jgi:hypothetical protein